MAITVEREPKEMYDNTGIYEVCVFCEVTTVFWHKDTNNPVCKVCAETHSVSELKNWFKNKVEK